MKCILSPLFAGSLCAFVCAQLPKVSSDFHEVTNKSAFFKKVPLRPEHKAMLRKNHFVQYPSQDIVLYNIYGTNVYDAIPSLVTVDNSLQIYHIFFDSTLRLVEEKNLLPELEKLTASMVEQSAKRLDQVKGTPLESAARKNLAYFNVAAKLLKNDAAVNADVEPMVSAELAKIDAHAGFGASAIFPYEMDFSQFVIRGHYTRSADLGRYFKAMLWYGLAPISIGKRVNKDFTLLPEQIQQASLIALDLDVSGALSQWRRIYDVSSLYAGKSNRLTPSEWEQLMRAKLSGDPQKALSDPAQVRALGLAAQGTRPPLIVTKKNDAAVADDIQVRFMGQRQVPDSVIFSQLTDPDHRPFPSPLDVAAVLGGRRAKELLDANASLSKATDWPAYKTERNRLTAQFGALGQSVWSQDLYWSWLDVLRDGVKVAAPGTPSVFKTSAWQDHQLNATLASWAELRHDTILYGEQTVSEMGDGEDIPYVRGYVEPNLALYGRMLKLVSQTEDGLKGLQALSDDQASLFKGFKKFLDFMITVSTKELAGQKLTKDEHGRIQMIEGELETLNTSIQIVGQNFQQLTNDDRNMALIADVHSARGKALTVGVGISDDIVAIVPIEGKLTLARGTALSYYEFLQPISDRLTDEKWKSMVTSGKAPARPSWTSSFFVNKTARPKDQ